MLARIQCSVIIIIKKSTLFWVGKTDYQDCSLMPAICNLICIFITKDLIVMVHPPGNREHKNRYWHCKPSVRSLCCFKFIVGLWKEMNFRIFSSKRWKNINQSKILTVSSLYLSALRLTWEFCQSTKKPGSLGEIANMLSEVAMKIKLTRNLNIHVNEKQQSNNFIQALF